MYRKDRIQQGQKKSHTRGFSFVEVIIVSAVTLLFFGGLFSGLRVMLILAGESKAETGARSLALSRMEYIRSLDYEAVGTISGAPEGAIPQHATTTLNGVVYRERVLILFVDRPEDGLAADDENGVLEDGKRVRVEYVWDVRGKEETYVLLSDLAPKGMETSDGGGTLITKILDDTLAPVAGASVHIYNDSDLSDVIDVTTSSNADGRVIVPGLPARGGYELTVTDDGYSTDGTYDLTAENPNPNPPHVSVASSSITTMTFFIDRLSNLTVRAIGEPVTETFTDTFDDGLLIADFSDTTVGGGALTLGSDGAGGYVFDGTAYATTTAPSSFTNWDELTWSANAPADTTYRMHISAESNGTYTLVSDTDLPGNSAGFTTSPVDLSNLSAAMYPRLAPHVSLTTSDASSTPSVDEWHVHYVIAEPPIGNVTFDLAGMKTIGTGVYKYDDEITTDSDGTASVSLEWDTYTIAVDSAAEGYDIKEVYGIVPYVLPPNVTETLTFVLVPHTPNSVHVTVTDTAGAPLSGATVTLDYAGYTETFTTSAYGQVFFADLASASATLTVERAGYVSDISTLAIDGTMTVPVQLALSS